MRLFLIRNDMCKLYVCDYFCTCGGNVKGFTVTAQADKARELDERDVELLEDFMFGLGLKVEKSHA